jgi:hypothetical protein
MAIEKDFEQIMKDCREQLKQGSDRGDLIIYLHQHGATIIESIKVLMDVYGLPLGDTKRLVSAHPVWKDVVAAATPLHEELEEEIENEANRA